MPPARTQTKRPKRAAPKRASAKAAPRRRARRSSAAALRLPVLEQRHLDLIGLGLVAIAVFLVFPLWLAWEAGAAGDAVTDTLKLAVGEVAYAVPLVLAVVGALVVLRPVLPAVRPLRTGALCLFAAVTLALAAGTLGLGPDGERPGFWNEPWMEEHGGIVGEALLYACTKAVGTVGAHILAIFLFLAGAILLTGASVAGVLRATHAGVADTTRAIRTAVPARGGRDPGPEPVAPPEPEGEEVQVTSTRDRTETLDASLRYPDIFGEEAEPPREDPEPEPFEEPVAEEPPDAFEENEEPEEEDPGDEPEGVMEIRPEDLTPQGRLRASITDDPSFQ